MKRRDIWLILLGFSFLIISITKVTYGLTMEEEKKYGRQLHQEILRSASTNSDPYITIYLSNIKKRLEEAAGLPFPITFTIIDSEALDAYATIGGYVYITTGLTSFCENEDELAGVISHEFAHITRRHVAKRLEKEKYINIGMLATLLLGAMAPGAGTKEALMTMGAASAQTLSLKYSREDEDEADRIGSEIAVRADYSGLGVVGFLKRLRLTGGESSLPQYLLTHPYHEERIKRLEARWRGKDKERQRRDFLPFLAIRIEVLGKPLTTNIEEAITGRYLKDKEDPVNTYAMGLLYMKKGRFDESIKVLRGMNSPYRDILMAEVMVNARRFGDAIAILRDKPHPVASLFLAKAYEGIGEFSAARETLATVLDYAEVYPEILYRYGMLLGRSGDEAGGHEYLGRYYLATGRQALARTNLEKAIAKYGMNSEKAKELLKILSEMEKG
jgi:predicted Zn-dependent protease